jgi:hypothetical protein
MKYKYCNIKPITDPIFSKGGGYDEAVCRKKGSGGWRIRFGREE